MLTRVTGLNTAKEQILAFSLSLFKSDFASVRTDTPIEPFFLWDDYQVFLRMF